MRATGTGARARCGRRWRDSPPRSVAPASTSSRPPVGEVRRDLDPDVGHQPPRLARSAAACRRSRPASPTSGQRRGRARSRDAGAPVLARRPRRRSRPAPRRSSGGAGRSSGGSPPGGGRARRAPRPAPRALRCAPPRTRRCPTRIPLVNGMRSSPAARIVSRRRAGCLVGEPWWTTRSGLTDSSISPCEAVTSRSRARSSRESTPRFVCGSRPRSSARSHAHDHVGGEVLVAPGAAGARATSGLTSGCSPVSTSSSLTARRGAVEQREHLVGLVQVRLVGGEGAVLAVAPAGPRQREREVAREGDAPARHSRAVYGGRVETPVCDVSPPGACATGGSRSWAGSGSWSSARWRRGPPGRRSRATSTCPARTPSGRSTCSRPASRGSPATAPRSSSTPRRAP